MAQLRIFWLPAVLILGATPLAQSAAVNAPLGQTSQVPPAARVVDLKASDGTLLRASYFAAAKPGPGVLLLHQGNRTRHSWDDLAEQLAAAGINTLTLDMRGYGESGGKHQNWPRGDSPVKKIWADDIDAAWKYLTSQPGVNGDVIGLGTAQLADARHRDPKAQLFPEVVVTIMGYNHMAVRETKLGVEIMKLVVNAYPDSADAYGSLSDAYLADGDKDLARQTAEKALDLLDSHAAPASSWSDTEERRKLIRDGAQDNLKQLGMAVDH